ncbi:MAG TPA: 50S ribosomal protein L29 [Nitrospiria bacterium]
MELQEIRTMSGDELIAKVKELRKELFNLRYQIMTEQGGKPQRIKQARREIARIMTVMREKQGAQAGQTAA